MFAKPLTALLATLLLCGACASSPALQMPAAGCSTLIPSSWAAPVPSAPLPADDAGEVEWVEFGIGQSGQLAKANGRTADVVEIVRSCETRDANSARRINAKWWQFWL